MNFSTTISECVIPRTFATGCFGLGTQIVEYNYDTDKKGTDQFSSSVNFLTLKVKVNDKEYLQEVNVVIKFQLENQVYRQTIRSRSQFENEILMYSKLLPMIDVNGIVEEIFCKYYCGAAEPNLDDEKVFIMLEDLSKKKYRLSSERVFLDYDHCVLALKEIGRFHALSYAAKERCPSEFLTAVSSIKEKWDANRLKDWKYKLLFCGKRGVLPVIKTGRSVSFLEEFLNNYDDPEKFYSSLVKPIEPEAVLCHGDFCRNNMLFHYDSDDNKPISVKFFDLQTPRYSSPVIDLSFFLLMNTNKELREKHWDDLINIYKESVKSVIPWISVPDLDFKRVGVYGYLHCSFFLPVMMDRTSAAATMSTEEFLKLSTYDQGVLMSQIGSENETKLLVDVIEFLLEKDYLLSSYY